MKKKEKQHPLLGVVFKAVLYLLARLPFRWNHRLGAFFGWMLWKTPNPLKRTSESNLKIAFPELSEEARETLLGASMIELGKTVTEMAPLWLWPQEKILPLVQAEEMTRVEQALARGKGVILLSPHLGAWELMGWYGSVYYPVTSLYRPPRVGSIAGFMKQARERAGARLVPTDVSGVRALFKALRRNEIVGILPDQYPGKKSGVVAPFFGHPAKTMGLVAKLAQKAQCPVFYAFAERLPEGKGFRIHICDTESAIADPDEPTAAAALNRGVEACVRMAPSQYQWSYRRYKKVSQKVPTGATGNSASICG